MGKFGLLGEKLGHSFSPEIHHMLADYEYELYEVPRDEVYKFLEETDLDGMNVTIPYKKTVIDCCTGLSDIAKRMGAVNLIVKKEDGWHADNTDYYGFRALQKKSGIDIAGKKVLVFGSGGASNTVVRALEDLNAAGIVIVSRGGENNYDNLSRHYDADVIINTTPLGMYPYNGGKPCGLKHFPKCSGVLDVVYNPLRTALLLEAEELGIPCAGGLYMLVAQAKRAAEIFLNKEIDDSVIGSITSALTAGVQNIIIIGMPGAGKTTVSREIARQTGRDLIEIDDEIIGSAGKSIPEIFAAEGEEAFRKLETEAIARCCKLSGKVISMGGGCVTREENYPLMHQNGKIFWLKRDISLLPSDGRPVSLAKTPAVIYNERETLYERFADAEVVNDSTIPAAAEKIIAMM